MALLYRAQIVLLIATGHFTSAVYRHARDLAETNSLQAISLDADALASYAKSGVLAPLKHLQKHAADIWMRKRAQIAE
jgi:hypothetical protein